MRWACTLLLIVGCADASKHIEKLADRACACKDATCAAQVIDDLLQLARDNPHMSGDQQKAIEQTQRLSKCAVAAGMPIDRLTEKLKALQDVH